jgi:glutathionyl-hydroquinone reductase
MHANKKSIIGKSCEFSLNSFKCRCINVKEFQVIKAYSSLYQTRALYKTVRLSMVEKEEVM